MSSLEQSVLERVRPTSDEEEERSRICSSLLERARELSLPYAEMLGGHIVPEIVGSVAKGTHLRGADIDLFLLFPETVERDVLERVGKEIGMRVVEQGIQKYAEHPYVRGKAGSFFADVVPCYAVGDLAKRKSAVDRTPFQSAFIREHLPLDARDQVRLLKQFFKGTGVYGAEARIAGFSGYLCELLVLKYGSFERTLRSISRWSKGEFVSVSEGGRRCEGNAVLCLPDPVDPSRNVAAAVGPDAFATAVIAARQYLASPSENFFFPPPVPKKTISEIRRRWKETGYGLLLLTIEKPDIVEDNLYPQVYKARRNITALLEDYEFHVERSVTDVSSVIKILFLIREGTPSLYWRRDGPEGWSSASADFIQKHRGKGGNVFVEGGRVHSIEKRDHPTPEKLLLERLGTLSLGADLDKLRGKAKVQTGRDILVASNRGMLTELLFPAFRWASGDAD